MAALVLHLSGDSYQGSPTAEISVEGVVVLTTPVAAPHGRPEPVVIVLEPGQHVITVRMTADAYGGSPDKDRNLYVESATFDDADLGLSLSLFDTTAHRFLVGLKETPSQYLADLAARIAAIQTETDMPPAMTDPATGKIITGSPGGPALYVPAPGGTGSVPVQPTASAPGQPTVTLTAGNGQITVAFVDGSTGGAAITSHKLYQGSAAGGETLAGTITTGSPYVITGLTNGAPVYVQVSAVNSAGEGARSVEHSATPVAPAVPVPVLTLTAPSGVQAGASYTITGTYTGEIGTPTLTVSVDSAAPAALPAGSTMSTASNGAGTISLMMPGATAGSHTVYVRDQGGVQSAPITVSVAALSQPTVSAPSAGTLATPVAGDGTVAHTFTSNASGAAVTSRTLYIGATRAACQANISAKTGAPLMLGTGGTFTRTVANGTTEWVAVTETSSAGEGDPSNFAWGTPQSSAAGGGPLGPNMTQAAGTAFGASGRYLPQALTAGGGTFSVPITTGIVSFGFNFKCPPIPSGNGAYPLDLEFYSDAGMTTGRSGLVIFPAGQIGANYNGTYGSGSASVNIYDGAQHYISFCGSAAHGGTAFVDGVAVMSVAGSGTAGSRAYFIVGLAAGLGAQLSDLVVYDGSGPMNQTIAAPAQAFAPPTSQIANPSAGVVGLYRLNGSTASGDQVTPPAQGTAPANVKLGPGIHFQDVVYTTPDDGGYTQTIASGVVLGLDPTINPTITLTGNAGTNFYRTGPNGLSLAYGVYQGAGTWQMTWTATDGTTTFTKSFTVISQATGGAVNVSNNVMTDAGAGSYLCNLNYADCTGPITFSDPSGFFTANSDVSQVYVADPSSVGANLGMKIFQVSFPVAGGGTHVETIPVYLVYEPAPAAQVNLKPVYDWAPNGTVLAAISAYSVAGISNIALTQSDGSLTLTYSYGTATISVMGAQTAGTKSCTIAVTSNSGLVTPVTIPYTILAGIVLDPSNLTLALPSTTIDNSMRGALLGTPQIAGMSGTPVWSFANQDTVPNAPPPMFTQDAATGRLAFYGLPAARADGHTVVLSVNDGPHYCTRSFNIPVVWKVGPMVHVGRGMAAAHPGMGYDHFSDLLPSLSNRNNGLTPEQMGMTVLWYADSDPDYFACDNGNGGNPIASPQQNADTRFGIFGPIRFVNANPNGPRVRIGGYVGSASGGDDAGDKGFLNIGPGDFYMEGFEVSFVQGYGSPDTDESHGISGVRKNANTGGDFTAKNCCFHDCNNGVETGAGGQRTTIDSCVAYNNGGQTVSTGQTHAYYLVGSELIFTNNLSYNNNTGHCLKTRCLKGTITGNRLYDGEGGSCSNNLNIPDGGVYTVANNVFHKGPNYQNPYCLGYVEGSSGGDRKMRLDVKNNTFIVGGVLGLRSGVAYAINHGQCISAIDGGYSQVYADGNSFYISPQAGGKIHTLNYAAANQNTWIETNSTTMAVPPALDFTDPGTANPPASAPSFYNNLAFAGDDIRNMNGVQQKSSNLDVHIPTSTGSGVTLANLTAYGANQYKNDNVPNDIRINPFVAGTTWQITQDGEYFPGAIWAATGKYTVTANSDGTAAVLATGSVARTAGYDLVKVRATAPNGTLSDWRYYINVTP